ncbi:uncharacterized protein LOC107863958 isoform X2 [Capsicum annuum]|nr:uncharacterized protein LOC107863958 isoform X2 [Capsicum annuum]XP_047265251.1 uncharacterized protein LOC107863958 isoform X2 [Capsicum annuum]
MEEVKSILGVGLEKEKSLAIVLFCPLKSVDHLDKCLGFEMDQNAWMLRTQLRLLTIGKMTNESQMQDEATTVGVTSITSTSRANAPQPMAPAEKPGKFTGIDFKR